LATLAASSAMKKVQKEGATEFYENKVLLNERIAKSFEG
jgi:hypothetical protein